MPLPNSAKLLKAMQDAKLINDLQMVSRVIIDIRADAPPNVIVMLYPDDRINDVFTAVAEHVHNLASSTEGKSE